MVYNIPSLPPSGLLIIKPSYAQNGSVSLAALEEMQATSGPVQGRRLASAGMLQPWPSLATSAIHVGWAFHLARDNTDKTRTKLRGALW
jgi:hypothetical protein